MRSSSDRPTNRHSVHNALLRGNFNNHKIVIYSLHNAILRGNFNNHKIVIYSVHNFDNYKIVIYEKKLALKCLNQKYLSKLSQLNVNDYRYEYEKGRFIV